MRKKLSAEVESAISVLLEQGLTLGDACRHLGFREEDLYRPEQLGEAEIRELAVEALGELLLHMRTNAGNFKTSEVLSVIREALTLNGGMGGGGMGGVNVLPRIKVGGMLADYSVGSDVEEAIWEDLEDE